MGKLLEKQGDQTLNDSFAEIACFPRFGPWGVGKVILWSSASCRAGKWKAQVSRMLIFLPPFPVVWKSPSAAPQAPFQAVDVEYFDILWQYLFWDWVLVIPAYVKTMVPASGIGAKDRLLWGVSLLWVVWAPLRQRLMQGAPRFIVLRYG